MSITTSESVSNKQFMATCHEASRFGCELKMDTGGDIILRVNTAFNRHPRNDFAIMESIDVVGYLTSCGVAPKSFLCMACGPVEACYHCIIRYDQEDLVRLIPRLEDFFENERFMNEERFFIERYR